MWGNNNSVEILAYGVFPPLVSFEPYGPMLYRPIQLSVTSKEEEDVIFPTDICKLIISYLRGEDTIPSSIGTK